MKSFVVLCVLLQLRIWAGVCEDATSLCSEASQSCNNDPMVENSSPLQEEDVLIGLHPVAGIVALTPDHFDIKLPNDFPNKLYSYVETMGILSVMESIAFPDDEDSPYDVGDIDDLTVRGYHWWMERTRTSHIMAPQNEISFTNVLAALKDGGFDEVLQTMGSFFPEVNNLTIYHAAVHGMTTEKVIHSGEKTFTMVIPILLSEDEEDDSYFNVSTATLLTNEAHEVVGGVVLILSIGENGDVISLSKHQSSMTNHDGMIHWSRQDPHQQLPPKQVSAGDFVFEHDMQPGQIEPLRWFGDPNDQVSPYLFQVGLPTQLTSTLLEYCNRTGITEWFEKLLLDGGSPLRPGTSKSVKLTNKRHKWWIQRPEQHWNSNMHWISPEDKNSQQDYLKVLSKGGFDKVLDAIGKKFHWDGLVAYHITFIGVSQCEQGYDHSDFSRTGGKGFNIIIPLLLSPDSPPELDVHNDHVAGTYKYQLGVATMLGDDVQHATAPIDYRPTNTMRMAATIYVADINQFNVGNIMQEYTQKYPPKGNTQLLLKMAGTHWKRDDESVTLPRGD